ncbi:MAG: glycosyltransferase family 2 protein [Treponema sp.]|jgi:GT2 family glycosyltransferase|nr:glycosyltransferase family 2 protein [Treponema sp.]
MKVSIIIPTYNRETMLCNTLANIVSFEHQYHELIVVDQTKKHDQETQSFLDDLTAAGKITWLYVDYPNLPNARNVGIGKSSGDIVLFFDDDVEINEKTIPSHVSGFNDRQTGCVTGKITIQNINTTGNKVLEKSGSIKKHIKSLLFLFFRKRASYVGRLGVLSDFSGNKMLPADSCIGCNMSFRKDVFEKCGSFDTQFTGNAIREDTDMSVRLRRGGYKIAYIPQAALVHYMDNAGGTRTAATQAYWHTIFKNQCYFYIKNFRYSRLSIMLIHIFDFFRCSRQGLKPMPIFRQAWKAAKVIASPQCDDAEQRRTYESVPAVH